MSNFLQGKKVLVTGVCGTVGREITKLLLVAGAFGELDEFVGVLTTTSLNSFSWSRNLAVDSSTLLSAGFTRLPGAT